MYATRAAQVLRVNEDRTVVSGLIECWQAVGSYRCRRAQGRRLVYHHGRRPELCHLFSSVSNPAAITPCGLFSISPIVHLKSARIVLPAFGMGMQSDAPEGRYG